MKNISDHFVGIDGDIVERAKSDLVGRDIKEATLAAMWFFLDGKDIDDDDPKTFDALCGRNFIDADHAARAIWNQLTPFQRTKIAGLLKNAGLNAQLPN